MKLELNSINIEKAKKEFLHDEVFQEIILPRLKIILNIKKELKNITSLFWDFEYNAFNTENNKINIKFNTNNPDFDFNYQIPLRQSFELRLFLSNSSIHFIKIYNFITDQNFISKEKYPLRAQYRVLPHLILSTEIKRYDIATLNRINKEEDIIDTKLLTCIKLSFDQTIKVLEKTILNFNL